MVIFQRNLSFFKVPGGGVQFFPGGGGSNCLFPLETHITCDFPGGGVSGLPVPPPPLDPHLQHLRRKYEGQSQAGFSTFLSRAKEGKALGFQNLRMDAVLNS